MTRGGPDPLAELAVVERNGFAESRHYGSLVALAADGTVAIALGTPEAAILPRSSVKPWQALACLEAGLPLTGEHTAIAAGSHTGEDVHVQTVRAILGDAGLTEADLSCPPDWPEDVTTRVGMIQRGEQPARIRMNCSGKHAAMLAACAHNSWDIADYLHPDHPLQQRVRAVVEGATDTPSAHVAVDGCGAPLFATTVVGLARAGRGLVTAENDRAARVVGDAMRQHPFYVGGTGHPNTEVMRRIPGTLCKGGAEGVIVAAASTGQAVAMKVIDGSPRATTMLALAALAAVGVDTAGAGDLAGVDVLGGGRPVGRIRLGQGLRQVVGPRP